MSERSERTSVQAEPALLAALGRSTRRPGRKDGRP
jgi:hypothetical protein